MVAARGAKFIGLAASNFEGASRRLMTGLIIEYGKLSRFCIQLLFRAIFVIALGQCHDSMSNLPQYVEGDHPAK